MSYQDPNQQNQYGGYVAPQPAPSGEQQQPPYSQPQAPYGQQQAPYGQQGMGNSNDTSMGMAQNVAVVVSYAFWWVTGLIVFFTEKKNHLVRFHAMQSILTFGAASILIFILNELYWAMPYGVDTLFSLMSDLVSFAAFVLWVFLLVNAWQGRYFKLPIVGDYAERFTK